MVGCRAGGLGQSGAVEGWDITHWQVTDLELHARICIWEGSSWGIKDEILDR